MEVCNTDVVRGNTAIGEGWMGTAPKELATVMRPVEGTIVMRNEPVMEMAVVEAVMKVPMIVVKDDE